VVDNLMPALSGLELIREVVGNSAGGTDHPQILMMTAHATVESAIEAMKLGALDYLQKPFEIDEFLVVARRAIEHGRLRTHHDYLITERDEQFDHYGIVGTSRAIQEVARIARLVAQSRSTVLLSGETGTGKELVARAIHNWSAQRDMPLVRVNCAALPETLIESELFGHVRGAFTDARADRVGRFELADGGTLFLDEIANVPPSQQAKLLRVIAAGEFERLGSSRTRRVDVRILSATNAQIDAEVAAGRFRQDLLFRLNTIEIVLPALRDRRDDIPSLATHFLEQHARRYRKPLSGFDSAAMDALLRHPWPGNVRELEHAIERAVLMAAGPTVAAGDLGLRRAQDGAQSLENMSLEDVEAFLIRKAIGRYGSVTDAAKALGLSRSALYRRLERYGIEP
jgi:DNA-binding NtrC family response regulator